MEAAQNNSFRLLTAIGCALMGVAIQAQTPDLLNAFDAGGRSLGLGSSLGTAGTEAGSELRNPAGLAYVASPTVNVVFRNMTESNTRLSGNWRDPDYRTQGRSGNRTLSKLAYALPNGKNSVLGLSYELGGYIKDFRTGDNLLDGPTSIRNYAEIIRAKTDYFTVAIGRHNSEMTQTIGYGLVVANHNTSNQQQYSIQTGGDPPVPVAPVDNRGSGVGIGAVAGAQFTSGNQVVGVSVQTPIALNGTGETSNYYKRIPGRISVGVGQRIDNPRRPDDFLLFTLQGDYYFGGDKNAILARSSQLVLGSGIEYSLRHRNATIPLRAGFRAVGRGGNGFTPVNGFTFGIGYNPDGADYGLDLDFGSSSIGGTDMSLALTYRLRK